MSSKENLKMSKRIGRTSGKVEAKVIVEIIVINFVTTSLLSLRGRVENQVQHVSTL